MPEFHARGYKIKKPDNLTEPRDNLGASLDGPENKVPRSCEADSSCIDDPTTWGDNARALRCGISKPAWFGPISMNRQDLLTPDAPAQKVADDLQQTWEQFASIAEKVKGQ
jgi:hypothetical protein